MTQSDTHYQIDLTNRQVVVGFVVLLGCLLLAFLSGVWIGRGSGTVAYAAEGALSDAQVPEESFSFFNTDGEESEESVAAPAAAEDSPAPDAPPVDAEPAPRARRTAARGPAPESTDEPAAATAASEDSDVNEALPPPEPMRARPEPTGRVAAQQRPEVAKPQTAAASGYWIQVFSGSDEDQAQKLLQRLRGGDLDADLSEAEVDNATRYRVRVGPFADREQAEEVAADVRRRYRLDTWIPSTPE